MTETTPQRARIFISYKRNVEPDEPVATQVFEALSEHHDVFIDRTMLVGTKWVESVFEAEFRTDFFSMLRSWHNSRTRPRAWKRLDLALIVSTEPYQLIDDLNQSPFNVGEVIELTDFASDFFAAIRYLHNTRAHTPDFRHLSFVLIGVATPSDLIADPTRTPFNIGQRVDLTDFTFEEAKPLAEGLVGRPPSMSDPRPPSVSSPYEGEDPRPPHSRQFKD